MPYIELALIVYVIIREFLAHKERREMLDRLMSRDLDDYKSYQDEEDNEILEDDDNTISILEAKDEILNGEK